MLLKLCASFHTHWWIKIWVTVRKRSIRVKIDYILSHVSLKSLLCYFKLCKSFRTQWSYSPEAPNLGQIWRFLELCNLGIWWMTLKNNTAPLLRYFKLCAAFQSHWWIQTGVSRETPNLGQIWRFLEPCNLAIWRMTLQNNRAPLLCYFQLCVSFRTHWWNKIWVTVRKCSIRVKIDDF